MSLSRSSLLRNSIIPGFTLIVLIFIFSTYHLNSNDGAISNFTRQESKTEFELAQLEKEEDSQEEEDGEETDTEDHQEQENCALRNVLEGPPSQDDPCILDIIRKDFLIPPSTKPYNIQPRRMSTEKDPKKETIEKYVDTSHKNGFFIECGANDGEFLSNSLQVEMDYGWTGLLVEANAEAYSKLATKNRKSWLINVCLSPIPYATQLKFYSNPKNSGVSGLSYREKWGATVGDTIQCFPLYSILAALNVTTVDYFSLDIEGLELEILKTIPFDLVTFKVLSVEHWSVPGGRNAVQTFLATKGYTFIQEINDRWTHDGLYVHNSLINTKATVSVSENKSTSTNSVDT